MNQKVKTLILAAVLIISLVAAVILYNHLSAKYNPNNPELPNQQTQTAPPTQISGTAADFTVQNADGEAVKLSDYFGKPIVINFWATWCGPCRSELPAFDSAHKEYGEEIEFLMVNLTDGFRETVDGVTKFVTDNGYEFPVYFDTEYSGSDAYSVYSIPLTVFIDKDGNESASHLGSMSESKLNEYLDALIDKN